MNVKRQGLSLLIAAMLLSLICCFSFTANAAEVSGTQDGTYNPNKCQAIDKYVIN